MTGLAGMAARQLVLPEEFRLTPPPSALRLDFTVPLIPRLSGQDPALMMRVWSLGDDIPMSGFTRTVPHPGLPEFDAIDADSAAIGRRWAALLRRQYPRDRAKTIARAFGVVPRTAEGWLSGQAPLPKVLALAAYQFGMEVVAEVLAPGARWTPQRVATALAELEQRLHFLSDKVVVLRAA